MIPRLTAEKLMIRELETIKDHHVIEKKKIKKILEELAGYDFDLLHKKLSSLNAKLIIIEYILMSYKHTKSYHFN